MKWTKVRINNFLSIEEADIDLDNRGLVLIEGINKTNGAFKSNGSGKSSLLEAIVYAIYDTTTKGIKADNVVNRVNKKNTSVILEGIKGEDKIRIERYRKHSKFKNKVKLFINGKDVSEKSTRDTNKAIEKLIGIDYKTYINSILFSQGSGAGKFALATDKEKKDILENLVNLQVYAKAQDIAKDKVREKESEILKEERNLERLQWELENIDSLEKQDEENYKKTKEMIKQEQENIKKAVEDLKNYAANNSPVIDQIKEEIEELDKKIKGLNTVDITYISNQVSSKYQSITDKKGELNLLIKNKEDLVSQYKKIQNDTHCPVCGSTLNQEHREKEMKSIKDKLRETLISIKSVESDLGAMEEEYNNIYQEYQREKKIYDSANETYQKYTKEIQEREKKVRDYEDNISTMRSNISNIQDTINKLNEVPKPKKRDNERKDIQKKIKEQREVILGLEKEKKVLEDVVKVYSNSGIRSHVLDLITPFLNERANTYLKKLSGSDIEINFTTQKRNKDGTLSDKFDVQVVNSTGGETYQANSEGEKKRIDLAISLAIQDLVLSKSNMATNVIFYDEVFDALDSVGSENVIELLKERLDTVGSIFVITHSEHLKNLFENIITVEKDRSGISRVIGGATVK